MQACIGTVLFLQLETEGFRGQQYLGTMMTPDLSGHLNGFLPLEFLRSVVHRQISQFQVCKNNLFLNIMIRTFISSHGSCLDIAFPTCLRKLSLQISSHIVLVGQHVKLLCYRTFFQWIILKVHWAFANYFLCLANFLISPLLVLMKTNC